MPTMIDVLERMCETVADQPTAHTAAQRFGMHLHDEGPNMSITFSPRDARFVSGAAIRRFGSDVLSGIDVGIAPATMLSLDTLRAAFGAFELVKPDHVGDEPTFAASYRPPNRERGCSIIVTLRARTKQPGNNEAVRHLSIARE